MNKKLKIGIITILMICLLWNNITAELYAEGADVYFGSSKGYEWTLGKKFPIGLYLESEEGKFLTEVEMLVVYDPEVLRFESTEQEGITILSEGKFVLKRSGKIGKKFKKLVYFTPLISGETKIEIFQASGKIKEEQITSESIVQAKVSIPIKAGCELRGLEVNGEWLEEFDVQKLRYDYSVGNEVQQFPITVAVNDGTEVEITDTNLDVGENQIYITTTNRRGEQARYRICVVREELKQVVADATDKIKQEEAVVVNENSTHVEEVESQEESNSIVVEESIINDTQDIKQSTWKQVVLKIAVFLVTLLVIFEINFLLLKIKKKKEKKLKKSEESNEKQEIKSDTGSVVIRANNVCMEFDRAVNEYTSVKELMIQTVKGKRVKERYQALNNISFEIHKGEVIGVVGTNGAGKSTLLKIIAGVLKPTSGVMKVNQKKIQILTLGTGFDMELTGKENVYLNGAIIGYEKEFIDKHYDQIVEFAELQDFMEEKVKNYSSGMVSRLGFAIATVGDAAEILILDEVLSVGDRIFQKKSMKRIKEMIHGGSTVIMVSHSTKTIMENCDKAIWIEKGHMVAMGDAKEVCSLYEKYDGDFERLQKNR